MGCALSGSSRGDAGCTGGGSEQIIPSVAQAPLPTVRPLASLPSEMPSLPFIFLSQHELIAVLKEHLMHRDMAATKYGRQPASFQASSLIAVNGMSGVGKTTTAVSLIHDEEVRCSFDKICWVSLGQEPDTATLQQKLYTQLTGHELPMDAQGDVREATRALKNVSRDVSVLLVLDDVWVTAHATPLNFVDLAASRSAVVITTRIHDSIEGAIEVQCGTLNNEDAIELLLRTAGCGHMLSASPPAAHVAVDLCGCLPLALGIVGAVIAELADTWQTDLIPLLKDEFEYVSVEERVVVASLRAMPEAVRAGAEAVFTVLAVFAEASTVPTASIDLLVSLLPDEQKHQGMLHLQRCLSQLLKANILNGSIEGGIVFQCDDVTRTHACAFATHIPNHVSLL